MKVFPLGGIITIVLLLPNLLVVFFPPKIKLKNVPHATDKRLQVMTIIERIGQIGCFVTPFFYRLNFANTIDIVVISVMFGMLVFYYVGWIRYLIFGRDEVYFYRSMLGFPIPMAVFPVLYFFVSAILINSVWLLLFTVILGIGHITVTWFHSRNIEQI